MTTPCGACHGRCGEVKMLRPPKKGTTIACASEWVGCRRCNQTGLELRDLEVRETIRPFRGVSSRFIAMIVSPEAP